MSRFSSLSRYLALGPDKLAVGVQPPVSQVRLPLQGQFIPASIFRVAIFLGFPPGQTVFNAVAARQSLIFQKNNNTTGTRSYHSGLNLMIQGLHTLTCGQLCLNLSPRQGKSNAGLFILSALVPRSDSKNYPGELIGKTEKQDGYYSVAVPAPAKWSCSLAG